MNDWFNKLERREQWIYLIGAVVVVVYLLNMLLWAPISKDIILLSKRNVMAAEELQWLRDGAKKIGQLRGVRGPNRVGSQLSLTQMVNQSAAREGFRISRMTPSGDREAQVWLDKVSFNKVLAWLDQMENGYGIGINNISINNADTAGVVNIRVRFKKGL